jgi:hypothetical protein
VGSWLYNPADKPATRLAPRPPGFGTFSGLGGQMTRPFPPKTAATEARRGFRGRSLLVTQAQGAIKRQKTALGRVNSYPPFLCPGSP